MALIVQKYGGTSVANVERIRAVAERVAKFKMLGHQVVVVLSAMSGETNRLIALAKQIQALAMRPETLANAAHAAWNCGRPDAANDLADLVESFGGSALMDVIRLADDIEPGFVGRQATA